MKKNILGVALISLASSFANAAVIDSADVAGYTTFQDTITGRVWLDMDNFFDGNSGTSGIDMINAATNAGFTFATRAEVEGLLNTLPLGGGEWQSYADVMGYGVQRQLIWGMYDDGDGNPYGWAYAYSNMSNWGYADNATDANLVQNGGINNAVDMGIWAYQTGNVNVSEPGSIALLGLGLAGLGFARKKKAA